MSDSFRDAWHEAQRNRAPKDVVRAGLTAEFLDVLNAFQLVEMTEPGEVLLDVDGIPNAVGPSTTSAETVGGCVFSTRQVRRLGLTTEQARTRWPNLTFIESFEGETNP